MQRIDIYITSATRKIPAICREIFDSGDGDNVMEVEEEEKKKTESKKLIKNWSVLLFL